MHLTHRKTCRVCGSPHLSKVICLGDQYLQGSFRSPGVNPSQRKIPCAIVRCDPTADENACGLLQMAHTVPPEILYATYWYRSGTNQTMRDHLAEIVKSVIAIAPPGRTLDIGCNDGTLLKCYPEGWELVGVDPSDIAMGIEGVKIISDVFPTPHLSSDKKFQVITSIAMFYDLEDPLEFARAIKRHLAEDGVWVVEMSYMPHMLLSNSYDTVCHEHLEYYSLSVLDWIMKRAGLKVFRAEINSSNGGSIRCYVSHSSNLYSYDEWDESIRELRKSEFDMELDTDKPYASFQERINVHRDKLVGLLRKLKAAGKRIHIYGASTKGNTILQWCGIDHRTIDMAADRNPEKHGAFTLGTDIPIVSEEHSRSLKPDYYLVLPWHFQKEFLQREAETIKAGTGMIFPLPEITIHGGAPIP